ncbi:MAG: 1-deoxy-D-xylulose-5-phosphate reductoisomerase [Alphaproteobacteria bacterium]|nr:1-deoxy-D-xylulose-5-phosphate reductoisomerase [Alphaproteobacteria bacterium]
MSARAERSVTILGSTGSVGVNTIDLIDRHNATAPGTYRVVALTANSNVPDLAAQAHRLHPEFVAVADPSAYNALKAELGGSGTRIAAGAAAVEEAALMTAEWVMASIVGAAGLGPTLAAVSRGATVALANKECLVCAGDLFMSQVRKSGATLLPVDSEHNAVFQCFDQRQAAAIEQVTLTASGGPFRTWTAEQMANVTPAQACKHPNYSMGAKISVDSATLMNKGLELIEAHYLFGTPPERLSVVVHPQQIVHALVGYVDGTVLAQLGSPDMRTPIAYALGYPDRIAAPAPRLDLASLAQLTFESPDLVRFPCLALAQRALRALGGAPTILNAANEVAVEAFLAGRIGFNDIAPIVEITLNACERQSKAPATIEEALSLDAEARARTTRQLPN